MIMDHWLLRTLWTPSSPIRLVRNPVLIPRYWGSSRKRFIIHEHNNWWVSNILTHISYLPSWIVVISSSFMCFNEFCECIGDLSTGIEIDAKKHTKRSNLEQRRNIWKRTEPPPIDSSKVADRSARNCKTAERGRAIADRLRHSSRSIGKFLWRITSLAPINRGLGADRSGVRWRPRQMRSQSIAGTSRSIGKSSWCQTSSSSRFDDS